MNSSNRQSNNKYSNISLSNITHYVTIGNDHLTQQIITGIIKEIEGEESNYNVLHNDEHIVNILTSEKVEKSIQQACCFYLAAHGKINLLNRFRFVLDFSYRDSKRRTILLVAAMCGQVEVMNWIKINEKNFNLSLSPVSDWLKNKSLIQLFSERDIMGRDLVLTAIYYGKINVLNWLKENNQTEKWSFSLDVKDNKGMGPIDTALLGGQAEMLALLLNSKDKGGYQLPAISRQNPEDVISNAIIRGKFKLLDLVMTSKEAGGLGYFGSVDFERFLYWSIIHNQIDMFSMIYRMLNSTDKNKLKEHGQNFLLIAMAHDNDQTLIELAKPVIEGGIGFNILSNDSTDLALKTELFEKFKQTPKISEWLFSEVIKYHHKNHEMSFTSQVKNLIIYLTKFNLVLENETLCNKISNKLKALIDIKLIENDLLGAQALFMTLYNISTANAYLYLSNYLEDIKHQTPKTAPLNPSTKAHIEWFISTMIIYQYNTNGIDGIVQWGYTPPTWAQSIVENTLRRSYEELIDKHVKLNCDEKAETLTYRLRTLSPEDAFITLAQSYVRKGNIIKAYTILLEEFTCHHQQAGLLISNARKCNAGLEIANLIFNGYISTTLYEELIQNETQSQKFKIDESQARVISAYEYLAYAHYQSIVKKPEYGQLYKYFQQILCGELNLISADANRPQFWTHAAVHKYFTYYRKKNPDMLLNKEFIDAETYYFKNTQHLRAENEKLSKQIKKLQIDPQPKTDISEKNNFQNMLLDKASKNPSSFYYRNKMNTHIEHKEKDNRDDCHLQRKRSYTR